MTNEERENAIKVIRNFDLNNSKVNSLLFSAEEITNAFDMIIKALEQEPKTGHWIIIDDCEKFIAKCSECGRIEDSRMISKYPYCHCGAKMQESED
jgi:hypothetical protein